MNIRPWIAAARLRTLPLALSTMIVGHALAASRGSFGWTIALWSILTALSLQILSNLSNDYGDTIHGADHDDREGPARAVQSGAISMSEMKRAIILLTLISLSSGVVLLFRAFDDWWLRGIFFILGLLAIWAAINYTAGDRPYGYKGKGDIAVFIFFGLVTVLGSYFLQAKQIEWPLLLPAITCGVLSVGVLNVNNIRDIQSDAQAGKQSIPVKIGRSAAIRYHGALLIVGLICLVIYGIIASFGLSFKWLFLLGAPLLFVNFSAVRRYEDAVRLDPYLKQLALSTSLILLLFSLGLVFG